MASRPTRGGGSAPPDDDFDILRGTPREGEGPAAPAAKAGPVPRSTSAGPPAAPALGVDSPPSGRSPADLAAALESVAAAERRLEGKLDEATRVLASIREFLAGIEDLRQSVTEAAEFTRDTKAATAVLQAESGNQAERLKDGRAGLDRAVAALGTRAEDLKAREEALGKGIGELRALWKEADERSKQLASEIAALHNHYGEWKAEVEAHREAMTSLSGALLQGDSRIQESVAKNAEAQRTISAKTHRTVERFAEENDRLLERVGAAREDFLDALRAEAGRARRWTVPALAAALVLAVPSFAAMGALAQSQFGVFDAYDDTNGWRQLVWNRHGERVKACLLQSERTGKVLGCRLRVDGRGIFGEPASELPPLPGE